MSIALTQLIYGVVAIMPGINTNEATIYVNDTNRYYIVPNDVVEVCQATAERLLAANLTNRLTWWTDSVTVYTYADGVRTTNSALGTNVVGFYIDSDQAGVLGDRIKEAIPYFIDTNTIYAGSTGTPAMLTVSNVFSLLGIGDRTNQWTWAPGFTNAPVTNYVINYTNFWPYTNGAASNICYTAREDYVVSYAASYTATVGHVWAASSNWPAVVVVKTNAASYINTGYVHPELFREYYKVLTHLKSTYITWVATNGSWRNVSHNFDAIHRYRQMVTNVFTGDTAWNYYPANYTNIINGGRVYTNMWDQIVTNTLRVYTQILYWPTYTNTPTGGDWDQWGNHYEVTFGWSEVKTYMENLFLYGSITPTSGASIVVAPSNVNDLADAHSTYAFAGYFEPLIETSTGWDHQRWICASISHQHTTFVFATNRWTNAWANLIGTNLNTYFRASDYYSSGDDSATKNKTYLNIFTAEDSVDSSNTWFDLSPYLTNAPQYGGVALDFQEGHPALANASCIPAWCAEPVAFSDGWTNSPPALGTSEYKGQLLNKTYDERVNSWGRMNWSFRYATNALPD